MHHIDPQGPQDNGLKEAIFALKDSGMEYIQSKSELALIEAKEAADVAKKKAAAGAVAAFFAVFTYAILLILAYSLILKYAADLLDNVSEATTLDNSQIVLILLLVIHLIVLLCSFCKLKKKPSVELFAITKSEIQKDKLWLKEMNNNAN